MSSDEYKPDCGYAWVVVAACFVMNFIMVGLLRAAGVLYVALIDVYGVSREVATMPFSLRCCLRNMAGPLVGALGQHFGNRPVLIVGGIVCGIGGILSAFAPDISWITFAWGGIHGIGYGMCNILHVAAINRYFQKYKGVALGINYTGDCFGTILLPLFLEFLLDLYGLSGTFLILAGISLNVVPAAMLLVAPPWQKRDSMVSINSDKQLNANNEMTKLGIINECFDNTLDECKSNGEKIVSENSLPTITINEQKLNQYQYGNSQNSTFEDNYDSSISKKQCTQLDDYYSTRNCKNHRLSVAGESISEDACKILFLHPCSAYALATIENGYLSAKNSFYCDQRTTSDPKTNNINALKNPSNLDSGQSQTKVPVKHISLYDEVVLNTLDNARKSIDTKTEIRKTNIQEVKTRSPFLQFMRTNTKPMFLIISATMALYAFLFISVFTIIIDYAIDSGIANEDAKYLIIAFSVTDIFGRIGFGIVLDRKWLPLNYYAGLTTGIMGLCILIIPFSKCFTFWIMSFSLCGFVQGGTCIMFPVLVDYYMEKNEESVALGCLNFYGGVLVLPVPSMIGFFRDAIGSYDGVFWTVGTLCALAGSLWVLEPYIVRKKEKKLCQNIYRCE